MSARLCALDFSTVMLSGTSDTGVAVPFPSFRYSVVLVGVKISVPGFFAINTIEKIKRCLPVKPPGSPPVKLMLVPSEDSAGDVGHRVNSELVVFIDCTVKA